MRAAAAAVALRRLIHRQSGSCVRWQLQDYSDHLARARALLNSSPWRPRGSPPPSAASLLFSSLSGTGESEPEEAVVLDTEAGTVRCAANYAPLSPISFIERAAAVYGARAAVVCGERRHTWAEARDRCARVAAALATRFGVARGDVVSEADTHGPSCYLCLLALLISSVLTACLRV